MINLMFVFKCLLLNIEYVLMYVPKALAAIFVSVSLVSHPLNTILCRLEREHLIEQMGFIRCLGNNVPMNALSCKRVYLSPRQ
jgi:hypothetical protein